MNVTRIVDRMLAIADEFDRLADMKGNPGAYTDMCRLCASRIRNEIHEERERDTLPAPLPSSIPPGE